eukprot:1605739-Amphidinium_carterae.2
MDSKGRKAEESEKALQSRAKEKERKAKASRIRSSSGVRARLARSSKQAISQVIIKLSISSLQEKARIRVKDPSKGKSSITCWTGGRTSHTPHQCWWK